MDTHSLPARLKFLARAMLWVIRGDAGSRQVLSDRLASSPKEKQNQRWFNEKTATDMRPFWTVGAPNRPASRYFVGRTGWMVIRALVEGEDSLELEKLFWAGLTKASRSADESPLDDFVSTRHRIVRSAQKEAARALLSLYPEKEFADWESLCSDFGASPEASPRRRVLVAMLSRLACDESALDIPFVSQDELKTHAPAGMPWLVWLALNNLSLGEVQGIQDWPGLQGWRVDGRLGHRVVRLNQKNVARLKKMGAVLPVAEWVSAEKEVFLLNEWAQEGALALATRLSNQTTMVGLLEHGANPNVPISIPKFARGWGYLVDLALSQRAFRACALLFAHGAEMKDNSAPNSLSLAGGHPWSAFYQASAEGNVEGWRNAEASLWENQKKALRAWSAPKKRLLVIDLVRHPLTQRSLPWLMSELGSLASSWMLCSAVSSRVPAGGQKTLAVAWSTLSDLFFSSVDHQTSQSPSVRKEASDFPQEELWTQAQKEALVLRVFKDMGVRANTVLDDFSSMVWDVGLGKVENRPVSALLWSTVLAPGVLKDLLSVSTPKEIEAALSASCPGWFESSEKVSEKPSGGVPWPALGLEKRGVERSWYSDRPLWAQAFDSVNPRVAFEALHACAATRLSNQPAPMSVYAYALSCTHSARSVLVLDFLEVIGSPAASRDWNCGCALYQWCQKPRDMKVIEKGLALGLSNLLEARLDQKKGHTPLMQAILDDDQELARVFLNHGADLEAKTQDGATVMGMAQAKGPVWAAMLAQARLVRLEQALAPPVGYEEGPFGNPRNRL